MLNIFMKSPIANGLAVVVLLTLITTLIASLVKVLGTTKVDTDKGWFAYLLPVFSILGLPAAVDLLQAKGSAPYLASVVFVVFLLNFILPILRLTRKSTHWLVMDWYKWSALVTVIGGFAVAGYLTFVKGPVACGPSGGCDLVQNSRFATLFGFLKVGELGLLGYVGILVAWVIWMWGPASLKKAAAMAIWAMSFFGVLLSAYLTFLEPFVIGATCMWCISSAVLMIILLVVSTPAAQAAFSIDIDEGDLE